MNSKESLLVRIQPSEKVRSWHSNELIYILMDIQLFILLGCCSSVNCLSVRDLKFVKLEKNKLNTLC